MKTKYLLIYFLSIILIFSLVFISGCDLILGFEDYITEKISQVGLDDEFSRHLSDENKKEIDKVIVEAEKEIQEEELTEGFEDYPEIITLKGSIWEGSELILIIDMDTRDVEGSVTFKDSNNTYNGKITEGGIDLDTYEITADCCSLWEDKLHEDASGDKCIDIRGQLSKDYKMAFGIAEVWTGPNEWIARSRE